jgi:hypothetical protein
LRKTRGYSSLLKWGNCHFTPKKIIKKIKWKTVISCVN